MLPAEKFFVPALWLEDIQVVMSGRTTVVGMSDLWRYISSRKGGASRLGSLVMHVVLLNKQFGIFVKFCMTEGLELSPFRSRN